MKLDYSKDNLFDKNGLQRLKDSYMKEGEESPQERYAYIARAFGSNPGHSDRLYTYLSSHWLSASTPILSYGRNKKGLPISCFLNEIQDTAEGLVDTMSETAWLSMAGGGVGMYTGMRSADDKSVGVMPHLKVYDYHCLAYKQGTTRRGSYAAYLDIDHPDIVQFIEMRKPTGDPNIRCLNLHHGINVTDKFMQLIEDCTVDPDKDDSWELKNPDGTVIETVSAKELWQKIIETRMQTGEPYLHFIDHANDALPLWLKDKGLKIKTSNLCVVPETQILTKDGTYSIASLEDDTVEVWNGEEWSEVKVRKTSDNEKIVRVETNSGQSLECTEYHKFYVMDGYDKVVEKRAFELEAGDKLIKFNLPEAPDHLLTKNELDYWNGFFTGDGCQVGVRSRFYFYGNKRSLVKDFLATVPSILYSAVQEDQDREYYEVDNYYFQKFKQCSCLLSELEGFADADGTIARNGDNESLQISNTDKEYLLFLQLRLQEIGIHSKVTHSKDAGYRMMPDGQGGMKEYWCKDNYRLLISSSALHKLKGLGFAPKRLKFEGKEPQRNAEQFIIVTGVYDDGRYSDTYCFTEHKRGMGMFNGILTGQCAEVELPTSEDRTAVCCLSSLNLDYWDDWKDNKQFYRDVAEMLDNVLDVFIEDAPKTLHKSVNSAKKERSIGIGVLGFHSLLQSRNVPFESPMAFGLNRKIFYTMNKMLYEANTELAKERGEAPDAVGYGYRFSHVMAVAPTASSSIIMGNTSPSIEPYRANAYRQDTSSGSYLNKNKHLDKILMERLDKEEYDLAWKVVINDNGSVQNLDCLTEWEKDVFKTAMEIDQRVIVQMAADRAPLIDQGQSVNLFFMPTENIKYVHDVHMQAWKGGVKSLYYCRSDKIRKGDKVGQSVKRVKLEDEECLACGS